jgi:hypothetical protein
MTCCVEIGCWVGEWALVPKFGDPITVAGSIEYSASNAGNTQATQAARNRPHGEK